MTRCPPSPAPLRVLLIDDGAHRVSLIHDELTRQGHLVVGVLDSALLIHDCVLRLQPDVVIVDSESPSRDTLEHLAAVSATHPRPVVVFVGSAHTPQQRQTVCELHALDATVHCGGLTSPAILVIGDVVRVAPLWAAASVPERAARAIAAR